MELAKIRLMRIWICRTSELVPGIIATAIQLSYLKLNCYIKLAVNN